jgi:Domain of unknown function (DUF5666)
MITNGMQRILAITIVAALVLVACTGGSDNVAGIDRTGAPAVAAYGPISAFGSVVVGGVHYDSSNASFIIDGGPGTQADLAIGDVVLVKGSLSTGGTAGVATSIRFDNNVEGPIASIDVTGGTLVVLGQTVRVTADTSFDAAIQPAALSTLQVDDVVEVSGLVQSDGSIDATRIERKPAGGQHEIVGTVSGHDGVAHRFNLNAQVVDYSAAQLEGLPGGTIANGQRVGVKGSLAGAVFDATRVEYQGEVFVGTSGEHRELEGLITRFASAGDFDVAGLAVTTTAQTAYEDGTAADLALNVKVETDGSLNSAGVLVATKVEIRRSSSVRIEAPVDSVDATASSLVLLGIVVKLDALTRLEDQSSQQVSPFALGNVSAGDYLEVRGLEVPAGSNQIRATLVQRTNSQSQDELRGVVQSVSPPLFSVLGVTIDGTGAGFEDVNSVAQLKVGDLVDVRGQRTADHAMHATTVARDD